MAMAPGVGANRISFSPSSRFISSIYKHPMEAPPIIPTPAKRSRVARWTRKILKLGVLVYLGLALVLYAMQNWLIFPGAATQGKPEAEVRAGHGQELVRLRTRTGEEIAVLFGPALTPAGLARPDAARQPTLLYFYGNGMSISACTDEFNRFRRLGVNMAIPEYVGYGLSSGKPSEQGVYATADAAYDWLIHRPDVDPKQVIAVGLSLGSAAAIDLARRRPLAGLATFSAFTSMTEMAHQVLPWFPTSILLRHHFENEKKIAAIECPVFLAHGTRDSLVPFTMNARLARAVKHPTIVAIEGGDHNDIFEVGGEELIEKLGRFIDGCRPAAR